MATEPVRRDSIPPLDLKRPLSSSCAPEWLKRSLSGLIADSTPARIPQALAPTAAQRTMIENHVCALSQAEAERDVDRAAASTMELMAAFNSQMLSPQMATIRSRGYLTALADLPPWAVEEACRRWLCGEAGDMNYGFAPSPPQLRLLALAARDRLVNYRKALERLLKARVEPEYSKQHRGEMLKRLAGLFRSIGATLSPASAKRSKT